MKPNRPLQRQLFAVSRLTGKIKSDHQRRFLVGDWYESLFHEILPASERRVKLARIHQDADLVLPTASAIVEVKGVGNGSKPQLFLEQFKGLRENVPFPYSHLLYLVCFYKVRVHDNGVSHSQLKECTPTYEELDRYLAEETREVFFLHHLFLEDLLKEGRTARARGNLIIRAQLRELRELVHDERRLRRLKLNQTELTISHRFRGFKIKPFTVSVIAPEKLGGKLGSLLSPYRNEENRKETA